MKRILILLAAMISVAQAQFSPTSSKTAFKNGISIGTRDSTAYSSADSLILVINRAGRLIYRSTDGYWKLLANAASSDYVPYTGSVDNVALGNFRLTARSIKTDSIYANSSAGMYLTTNTGATVAHLGAGGSIEVDFKGFAGYDANRSASYTARSFTDKGYVDSSAALRVRYTDTAAMLNGYNLQRVTNLGSTTTQNITANSFLLPASGNAITTDGSSMYIKAGNGNIYIGRDNVVKAEPDGKLTALSFTKTGGTSSQFLKADGSVDGNSYITGSAISGTTNYIPKFTSAPVLANSQLFDNGTNLGIGTASPNRKFEVSVTNANGSSIPLRITNSAAPSSTNQQGVKMEFANDNRYTMSSASSAIESLTTNYINGAADLLFLTNNGTSLTEIMRLTSGGNIVGGAFIKSGGTSSQFLKADGSVDGNTYATTSALSGYLPLTGGTLTGSLSGTSLSMSGGANLATSSGNVGVGTIPNAWLSTWKAVELVGGSLYSNAGGTTGQIALGQNFYYNGFQNVYINSAAASDYYQFGGLHVWRTASSGTAGTSVSFTEAMRISANRNLLIKTTTDNGTDALQVAGSVNATGQIESSGTGLFVATYADISTGENRGYRLVNTGGANGIWNITSGRTGVSNDEFVIRNAVNDIDALIITSSTGAATFSSSVKATSLISSGSSFSFYDSNGSTLRAYMTTSGFGVKGSFSIDVFTVATLPAGSQGALAMITDGSSYVQRGSVSGGGSVVSVVYHDGGSWRYL